MISNRPEVFYPTLDRFSSCESGSTRKNQMVENFWLVTYSLSFRKQNESN
jgi:hypothetical protein